MSIFHPVLLLAAIIAATPAGYVRREGSAWIMGTSAVERVVMLDEGRLLLKSLKCKASGRELLAPGAVVAEFSASLGDGRRLSSAMGRWELVAENRTTLGEGAEQLDLTVRQGSLRVTKHYVIYPGSSVIREWATWANAGPEPVKVIEPAFLQGTFRPGSPEQVDFHWMTGGESTPGSWLLKTEKLPAAKPREFDSYDPFPGDRPRPRGDGVNARIVLGQKQLWPERGWQCVPNSATTARFDVAAEVAAGDRLLFVVNMNGNIGYDTTAMDPTIAYTAGESHTASKEFSDQQGRNGWRYEYLQGDRPVDLVYYPEHEQWRKAKDNSTGTPFVSVNSQHPDNGQDALRVWTAPKAGRVRITGSVCNTGNHATRSHRGFRMGSTSYAPWYALLARDTKQGLFIGWDYFGHWASSFSASPEGGLGVELRVAGHKQTLAPGESLETPRAFIGLFQNDLDEAGNEALDWQYRYLWDYTREPWFPAVRMLGWWSKGTNYGRPGVPWTGGHTDLASTFRKVFRVADLMRQVGADVYHRDWGWWDRAGDWNGPNFRATGQYLRKSGMGQLIYAFLYTVDPQSRLAAQHPDWLLGTTLDLSKPAVVEHLKRQLDNFVQRWGDFEWRNDSTPTAPRQGDDTPLLAQDQGLRAVIRGFLDKYPACAFQAVNGGGNLAGYDYARYASTLSFSDGGVGILRNYYAALLLPPDKTSDIPDIWSPDRYDKATWRGLLCINFDMTGDTWDPAKLEGIRQLIDIYHYLQAHGVVGRWVRVYRPLIAGDDPTMYFQRTSGDHRRGIIIPKRPAPGAVVIRPKGLLAGESYFVSFQESPESETRTGADLMAHGIKIAQMKPGELIYLNLPLHPGSKLDTAPPLSPEAPQVAKGENMGYPGIELCWKPATDDNWISYYEIYRDGLLIDRVAKGTYYFDHSAGAEMAALYQVRAIDGAGNPSVPAAASGPVARRAQVVDDAGISLTGPWQRQADLQPAHAGTIARSAEKGATARWTFEGRQVLWFSKLGADCGKAAVSIDGGPPTTVDTYSADDIWGVSVYRQTLPAGRHTIEIRVLGEHGPNAKGDLVHVDGLRAEE